MGIAGSTIADRAEPALEVSHVADQRRAVGAQRLLETEIAGLAAEIAGLEQLELAALPPVVVRSRLHPVDRVHDKISVAERRGVGRWMAARGGHDRRQFFGRDRLVGEYSRRPAP